MGSVNSTAIADDNALGRPPPERVDGKWYPCKDVSTFEELPTEVKTALITAMKQDIRDAYEQLGSEQINSSIRAISYFTMRGRRALVFEEQYYALRTFASIELDRELMDYCNSLFGPHIPYVLYDRGILFIKNV